MIAEAQVKTVASFELRRATPFDHEALVEMYLDFEPKGTSLGLPPRKEPQRWLDRLTKYPNFVVLDEGRVIGHAVLCPAGDIGEVAVFVHQDFRSRGLGKRLLSEVINEAQRLGLRRVWGTTETDNVPMLRLAFSLGFLPGKESGEFYLDLHQREHVEVDEVSAT